MARTNKDAAMLSSLDLETPEFVAEVRAFARANLPETTRAKVLNGKLPDRVERTRWQRALAAKGWGAPAWPVSSAAVCASTTALARLSKAASATGILIRSLESFGRTTTYRWPALRRTRSARPIS